MAVRVAKFVHAHDKLCVIHYKAAAMHQKAKPNSVQQAEGIPETIVFVHREEHTAKYLTLQNNRPLFNRTFSFFRGNSSHYLCICIESSKTKLELRLQFATAYILYTGPRASSDMNIITYSGQHTSFNRPKNGRYIDGLTL